MQDTPKQKKSPSLALEGSGRNWLEDNDKFYILQH